MGGAGPTGHAAPVGGGPPGQAGPVGAGPTGHADPVERAKRRAAEGRQDSIAERDRLDSSRKTSPLVCPNGAIDIDSTHQSLDQVVAVMSSLIATKLTPA